MDAVVSFLIASVTLFAILTGAREILLYRKYLRGEINYLVSRERRNRRLVISLLLLTEAAFLFLGFFFLSFESPMLALAFWLPPLMLIGLVVYLSVQDIRETSRDIDRMFREASDSVMKKVRENLPSEKRP